MLKDRATLALSTADIYQWNNLYSANSQMVGQDMANYVFLTTKEEAGKVVFSHKDSNPAHAVCLNTANVLKVTANKANSNDIWFQFNKTDWSVRMDIKAQDWKYVAAKEDGTNIIFTVDLDKLRHDNGLNYLYLNAINANYGHSLQISKIEIDSKGNPVDLLIANCNEFDPNHEAGDNFITPKLDQEENGAIYGAVYNVQTAKKGDDLVSPVKYIKVEVYDGYQAPRFFFNYVDGTGNDGFEINQGQNNQYFYSKRTDGGTTCYYVDAASIRQDKGRAFLNSVRSANGQNIKVKSVKIGLPK